MVSLWSRRALSHLCLNGVSLGSRRARHCLADPPMSRCGLTWVAHASHRRLIGLTWVSPGLTGVSEVSMQNDHGLTRASPGLTKVSSVSPGSHRYLTGVSRVSHWSLAVVSPVLTGVSPVSHRGLTGVTPTSRRDLTGAHLGLARVSLGSLGVSRCPTEVSQRHPGETPVRPR